jgi:integrase
MAAIINGADRGRPGRWIVDFRDHTGRRRWITCLSREEAKARLSEVLKIQPHRARASVSADITVRDYVTEHWLPAVTAASKRRTVEIYTTIWTNHLAPSLGARKVRTVEAPQVRRLLSEKLRGGAARESVRLMMATARTLFGQAVEDGVITVNPAQGHGKRLRLIENKAGRQERVKAMDAAQLSAFLAACPSEPRYADLFLLLARTGLRLGEALGLQWPDVDLDHAMLHVVRAFSNRRIETPKSGHARTVDMSPELVTRLRRRLAELEVERVDAPVFPTMLGTPQDESRVRKAMARILAVAKLPHFSPHDLRHTFASLHLQSGTSPAYVQRQLGHASISLTVDTYGKWLPSTSAENAAKLDAIAPAAPRLVAVASGSKIRSNPQKKA